MLLGPSFRIEDFLADITLGGLIIIDICVESPVIEKEVAYIRLSQHASIGCKGKQKAEKKMCVSKLFHENNYL